MLRIWVGRAKTGKSQRMLEEIRALGDGGKQILLVPEHASHEAELDLCRACGDTASRHTEVLSFRRLCDRVQALTGGAAQVTLDAGGKLLTLQRAMLEVAPMLTIYRKPSRRAAFLQQMQDLIDELICYEVTPELLAEQGKNISGATGDKLNDLSLILGAYQARLHRPGLDSRDRLSKLCAGLEDSGYGDGKDVFVDGFTYFNAQERKVLEILLRRAASVTVALLGERSGGEIFEASQRTQDKLLRMAEQAGSKCKVEYLNSNDPSPLGYVERYFFGETVPWPGETEAVRVRESDTVFSEVERTAAEILKLVSEGRCRFRDITVAARNMEDYNGAIETVFERYGIPVYLSRRSDLLEKPVLAMLTGALAAVNGGFEYEDLFRCLKTGLAGLEAAECDLLENYVLKWEIHGNMWLRDVEWTANPDGYGAPQTEASAARLAEVNRLRTWLMVPFSRLSSGIKGRNTTMEKVQALYTFMEDLRLRETLESLREEQAGAGRLQEAEETAQLWDVLCGVLEQFAELLGEETLDADEFVRLLRQVLTQYSVGTIPVSLDQVSVSEITRNDRHTVKFLFLLGANDHVLPGVGQAGGILNPDDREALALRGVELAPTGMEQMGIELQNLYAALAQPTEGLTVSYPASDVTGAELRPAFVIDRLTALFPDNPLERETFTRAYRLAAPQPALEAAGGGIGGPLWTWFAGQPSYESRLLAMERAAQQSRGRLLRPAVTALYGPQFRMSASRLERMRSCHFAYFMEYGLKAKARRPAAFDAPQIGMLLHYLLENITRDVMDRGGFAAVKNQDLRGMVRRYIDRYVEQELHNFEGRNARFRYLFSRLRTTAYAVVEEAAEELRHSDFVPLAFELSFGDGKDLPAVTVSEPDGLLRVGGKVDRVDGWLKNGKLYLRVVDYKSGKKSFDLAAVRMGLDIQMLLYLFTLQREGAARFGHDVEPAGALYLPARDEILAAERNIPAEVLAAERAKQLRRSGLLLSDPQVLQAMEHSVLEEPRYLPVRVSREGGLSGSLATAAQLGKLGRYVDGILHQIVRELRDGNIDADPCCHSEDDSFCRYCEWADACHFEDGRRGDRLRYITPVTPDDFWREVEERGGEDCE